MLFWSEFSIKQNANRAERYSQMNEARAEEEGGATLDGLLIEKAYEAASTTEPTLLLDCAQELIDLAERLYDEAASLAHDGLEPVESEDEGDAEDE